MFTCSGLARIPSSLAKNTESHNKYTHTNIAMGLENNSNNYNYTAKINNNIIWNTIFSLYHKWKNNNHHYCNDPRENYFICCKSSMWIYFQCVFFVYLVRLTDWLWVNVFQYHNDQNAKEKLLFYITRLKLKLTFHEIKSKEKNTHTN